MSQPVILFAMPCYDHRVTYETYKSTIELEWLLAAKGIPHGHTARCGDQFIAKARCKLASEFLQDFPMATHLFFLDDDIGFPPEAVLKLIEADKDVIAGIYPKKSDERDFPVELDYDKETGELIEENGLFRAVGAPTGFMCIKRHVLEKLAKEAGVFSEMDADGKTRFHYAIFKTGFGDDGAFWGEDYIFCRNWRAMGGEVWIDPSIKFTHRGHKKWTDTMSDHIDVFRRKASERISTLSDGHDSSARAEGEGDPGADERSGVGAVCDGLPG